MRACVFVCICLSVLLCTLFSFILSKYVRFISSFCFCFNSHFFVIVITLFYFPFILRFCYFLRHNQHIIFLLICLISLHCSYKCSLSQHLSSTVILFRNFEKVIALCEWGLKYIDYTPCKGVIPHKKCPRYDIKLNKLVDILFWSSV